MMSMIKENTIEQHSPGEAMEDRRQWYNVFNVLQSKNQYPGIQCLLKISFKTKKKKSKTF